MTNALVLLTAWSAGVMAAVTAFPARPATGPIALAAAAGAAALAAIVRPAAIGLALAAAMLGVARAELPGGDPGAAARAPALAGVQAVVEGVVDDDPRPLAQGYEVLVTPAAVATPTGVRVPAGKVMALVRSGPEPAPGDLVSVAGKLVLPRDQPGFDRRAYLAQQGAYLEMRPAQITVRSRQVGPRGLPMWVRERYRAAIATLLPPPHAQVLIGVVLGVRGGIPSRLQNDLIATGLVHLLVLSGLKVAVFARLARGALQPLLGRAATVPVIGLIGLYALVGGATPAGLRAAAMGSLALLALHLGRPTHVWTSLAATGAAMLAWRPDLALDVGFQLSFAGTVAIVLLVPSIERRLHRVPGWLREPFAVTCAAQVGTAPFMATDFHILSPSGPLANAAVLPLLPALIAAGILVAPLALVPDVGHLVAVPIAGLLAYVEQVAGLLARVPAASIPAPTVSAPAGAAYYAALLGVVGGFRLEGRARAASLVAGALIPLAIGVGEVVAWSLPADSVTVLNVGDGQAVLATGPGGYVLIDGGASPARLAAELGAHLPPWRHHLAALVITGPGLGHVGGLAGFAYPADEVVLPTGELPGTAWRSAALAEVARGARVLRVSAGQAVAVAGLQLEVLSPEADQAGPVQLALRLRGRSGSSFCDLADLDPEGQVVAAPRIVAAGGCGSVLVPASGRSGLDPAVVAAARAGRYLVSDAGGRLAASMPAGDVGRTSEEGAMVIPL